MPATMTLRKIRRAPSQKQTNVAGDNQIHNSEDGFTGTEPLDLRAKRLHHAGKIAPHNRGHVAQFQRP